MDWASDHAWLSCQEANLGRIFRFSPQASVAIKILKSDNYQMQIWSLETDAQWAEWLRHIPTNESPDSGLIAILAKRSGETGGSQAASKPMTYSEWMTNAPRAVHCKRPRRTQTFSALSEEDYQGRAVPENEKRQPGISALPFTYGTFKNICDRFDVHESFTKALTRTDVPSFSCEKVNMGYAAYVYNCRTSNSWPSDMAMSATHRRRWGMTYAVLYGCTTVMESSILKRLDGIGNMADHPMIMPGIFAELELLRHNSLLEACVVQMETEVFKLDFGADGQALGRAEMNKQNEEKREAWLDATYLRNSLITWNVQIQKMFKHAEELNMELLTPALHTDLLPDHTDRGNAPPTYSRTITPEDASEIKSLYDMARDRSDDEYFYDASSDGTEVESFYEASTDNNELSARDNGMYETNQHSILQFNPDAGEKIKARLNTMIEEYEEKIRDCTMRVDGMAMATKWSHSETAVEMALATNRESRVMKSISLVTMIFLPGTFFATVFSMTFFDWSDDNGHGRVSSYLWIYIVVTAFFTAGTIGMWYFVVIYRRTNRNGVDLEKQSTEVGITKNHRINDMRDKVITCWKAILRVCCCG